MICNNGIGIVCKNGGVVYRCCERLKPKNLICLLLMVTMFSIQGRYRFLDLKFEMNNSWTPLFFGGASPSQQPAACQAL